MFSCRSTNKVFIGIADDLKDKFVLNERETICAVRWTEFCLGKKRLENCLSLFICYFMFKLRRIILQYLNISYLHQLFANGLEFYFGFIYMTLL